MKKCEQIKDMILTDYIDGQLDKGSVETLENHLLDCSLCRAFLKEVKESVTTPFQQTQRQEVPAELWQAVRQGIEQETPQGSFVKDLVGKIKGFVFFPRLVPVFASFLLMFLAGSMTLNTIHLQQAQAIDQGSYLVSILSPTASAAQPESNDLGTPIEHYFL